MVAENHRGQELVIEPSLCRYLPYGGQGVSPGGLSLAGPEGPEARRPEGPGPEAEHAGCWSAGVIAKPPILGTRDQTAPLAAVLAAA